VRPIYRTGTPLPSTHPIFYIFLTNTSIQFFKHAAHSPFLSLKNAVYFIMLPFLVPVLFTVYIQGVLKKLKKFRCQKVNLQSTQHYKVYSRVRATCFDSHESSSGYLRTSKLLSSLLFGSQNAYYLQFFLFQRLQARCPWVAADGLLSWCSFHFQLGWTL
jgi:hypothetical protein